ALAHDRASSDEGLKIEGFSVPSPHSLSVNVFTPKCRNSATSSCCHSSCDVDGIGREAVMLVENSDHGARLAATTPATAARNLRRDARGLWLMSSSRVRSTLGVRHARSMPAFEWQHCRLARGP